MKALFSAAVFLNAALIFWVELLYAKRLLPALGGSPAVWNTSLMFYQVVLLAGYAYVLLLDRLPTRRQFAVHAAVLLLALILIPRALAPAAGAPAASPIPWLLLLLAANLGLPFFVISAGAPLLQRWFSRTGHPEGGDPYFLYAASNLGSFVALAAYPFLLEPALSLDRQTELWKLSFAGVGALVLVAGGIVARRAGGQAVTTGVVVGEMARGPAKQRAADADSLALAETPGRAKSEPIAPVRWGRWVLLAFVPSSLLLGVTTHITSEIAPVPLLWVVPLGIYLLTFVVAFGTRAGGAIGRGATEGASGDGMAEGGEAVARGGAIGRGAAEGESGDGMVEGGEALARGGAIGRGATEGASGDGMAEGGEAVARGGAIGQRGGETPGREGRAVLRSSAIGKRAGAAPILWSGIALFFALTILILLVRRGGSGWFLLAGDLAILTAAGLLCHARLARDRPGPDHLAEFYLWIAAGGALGGVFNTLVAPLLFEDPLEYPLVLALFAFLASARGAVAVPSGPSRTRPSDILIGLLPGLVALLLARVAPLRDLDPRSLLPVAGLLCLLLAGRPFRFGLGVAGLVVVGFTLPTQSGTIVFQERTFHGIHRVYRDGDRHWLAHGTTVHGGEDSTRPGVPLTYYHPEGPAGRLFAAFSERGPGEDRDPAHVALVGLGTGSLMAYAGAGEKWTLFELDPTVAEIAADSTFFTYLRDTPAEHHFVLGDARLSLEASDDVFDLIVVDAFSSDAIPVHLLTREAIALYHSRLRPGGWIAFHTSNRYADFSNVLAVIAADGGFWGYVGRDPLGDFESGRYPSVWILLATSAPDPRLDRLHNSPHWSPLPPGTGKVWTDDYSSLFEVLR